MATTARKPNLISALRLAARDFKFAWVLIQFFLLLFVGFLSADMHSMDF